MDPSWRPLVEDVLEQLQARDESHAHRCRSHHRPPPPAPQADLLARVRLARSPPSSPSVRPPTRWDSRVGRPIWRASPSTASSSATSSAWPTSWGASETRFGVRRGGVHQQPWRRTTGSEELYRNIRRLAEKKPLVAFVDGTAASAATSRPWPPTHRGPRDLARRLHRRPVPVPRRVRPSRPVGVKVEEVKSAPPQGGAQPVQAHVARGPRGAAIGGQRHL